MPYVQGFSTRACRANAITFLTKDQMHHRQAYAAVMSTARRAAKKRRLRWTEAREAACKRGIHLGFAFVKRKSARRR